MIWLKALSSHSPRILKGSGFEGAGISCLTKKKLKIMASLHKEYHKHPTKDDGTEIKMSVSYSRGIGYRVSIYPVKRSSGGGFQMEEFEAFSGFNDTLIKADRQSTKRLESAIEILKTNTQKYLNYFL